MKGPSRYILILPFLCFGLGSFLFLKTEKESSVLFQRGKEEWRDGRYEAAIREFLHLQEKFPDSELAPEALWESATICYFNLYDISGSLFYFEKLIETYPNSARVIESHLKLGELYEIELAETAKATAHWTKVLELSRDPAQLLDVRFRVAEVRFKSNDFDGAFSDYEQLAAADPASHIADQSQVRIGTILQIRRDYDLALEAFEEVALRTSCRNCRLQAQLGMVECYEYLDRLAEAIRTAENISPEDYPSEMKETLLRRLLEKRQFYEPSLWTGR